MDNISLEAIIAIFIAGPLIIGWSLWIEGRWVKKHGPLPGFTDQG